jgi:hypothetical protein
VKKLLVLCMAAATIALMPAIAAGQIFLNSDIWYDDVSNTVYGYSEAYTNYTFDFYYEADLSAQIVASGESLDWAYVTTSSSYAFAPVSVPDAEPNTDYVIYGTLGGCMYYYEVVYPYMYYYDYFNFEWTIQNDPCFDLVCTVCDGPGPPVWILQVACATLAGVWDTLHTGC